MWHICCRAALPVTTLSGIMACDVVSESREIIGVVEAFFNVGLTKDLTVLREIQLDDTRFSSFGDVQPYDLKDYRTSIALEELRFVSISDYSYEISDPKISVFGDTAIVAFGLVQKGMIVDNKSFTGQHITLNGRATFILVMYDGWKIVHIHMSKVDRDA